jgi:hypothetical protein
MSPFQLILRWLRWAVVAVAIGFVVLYLGDTALFALRGKPTASMTIQRYMIVPLKGNKQEYDSLGSTTEQCSKTLFPQGGFDACWILQRHLIQYVKV